MFNSSYVQTSGAGMAHHNVSTNGAVTHTTAGIMANTGFGPLTVTVNGIKYTLPNTAVTNAGLIKKAWKKVIASKDAATLTKKGATAC